MLSILADDDAYGYLISQKLKEGGLGRVKGGTLYPLLSRLEKAGFLVSSWQEGEGGPGRKVFTITAAGRTELAEVRLRWSAFSHRAGALINPTEGTR